MTHRSFAASCALAVGLVVPSLSTVTAQDRDVSRESAVRRLLMERALAFTRAHGRAVAPPSLDASRPPFAVPDANTLFERVGGKRITPSTLGTPETLFEQAIVTTSERMINGGVSCCLCSTDTSCMDGLFCNGAETCTGGICTPGSDPCVDGDPCTTDSCVETSDVCSFTPVPPPPEVARLDVSRSAPSSTVATLAWSAVAGASAYNIYRGAFANLGDLSCFQGGVPGTSQNDDGAVPSPAFYLLVTSLACGESNLGDGNPAPRPEAPGCP